ncbi:uncharacterized protein F4807DRAFT_431261 [Annulohypoxylon truncatum]|uniref:uncharacterized protein n=1 Tax=Annulohypoxylon truncatum TaxID=327061 RepID=UPI0020080ED9|nr:uncharacterized protein F4807DRAFT_431261 [Annulohypoxylon truncatum]KAI1208414.1 hypothetical protein F4807DRAFT_431261 [Annulohypoxylon truncatum]
MKEIDVPGLILPNLSTLYLQKDRRDHYDYSDELEIPSAFVQLGNLKRVHIWRIQGCTTWFGSDHLWLTGIRELKLVCRVSAKEIFAICESATQLENLSLVMTEALVVEISCPSVAPGKDLNCALSLRADTLRVLEFRMAGKKSYLRQFGSSGLLECLPQLTKLEKLTTEMPLIYDFLQKGKPNSWFFDKLPPNIVSLELVEWPTLPPNVPSRLSICRTLVGERFQSLLF